MHLSTVPSPRLMSLDLTADSDERLNCCSTYSDPHSPSNDQFKGWDYRSGLKLPTTSMATAQPSCFKLGYIRPVPLLLSSY